MKIPCPVIFIVLAVVVGCTSKKSTCPSGEGPFLVKDYFPLQTGDEWFWEVQLDSASEPFVDGDLNLGEPFIDVNKNGTHDPGEEYSDLNFNGKYDGPNDPWSPGVPYLDRNDNGQYDAPNGKWDEGEFFIDLNSDGVYSPFFTYALKGRILESTSVSSDGSVLSVRSLNPLGSGGDFVMRYRNDSFSNDSLGLRWHSHITGYVFSPQDDLSNHGPIIIAKESMRLGDSVISQDTVVTTASGLEIRTWTSVLEAVERVTRSGGDFPGCLRLRSTAWGWTGNMQENNGVSYQWYARNVGLVKLERLREGERWILDSATVGGRSYP